MEKINRRNALKWLGAGVAAMAFSPYVRAEKLFEEPLRALRMQRAAEQGFFK